VIQFGLGLMGYHGCWDDAAFAERHGFASAGFVDSPLLGGETFACMALAARETESMRLGTFLAVPSNRIAPIAAQGIATINRLAPGRTFLGLGTGYTSRNTFGLPALPVRRLRRYAEECRALLAGEVVAFEDPVGTRNIRFGHEGDYVATDPPIPIYIAADGPRALAATGELGDGWITTLQYSDVMTDSDHIFAASLAKVREAATAAGRQFDPAATMWSNTLCVLGEGESATSPRVLERVGAYAMMPFHSWADRPQSGEHLPPPIRERLEVYRRQVLQRHPVAAEDRHQETHRGHLSHLRRGEAEVLTEEIVRMTTLTGTAAEIAARLEALAAAGLGNLSIWFPPALTREGVLEVEREILPLLDRSPASSH
jgi:alkanesulfonate monooxygenase SsuD/methylene tetrahydromethanopterin reductase-like flavin-dependent oxidoreductase (luciferase family)